MKRSKLFGDLLKEAMHYIAAYEQKPLAVIQDEVGYAVGREGAQALYHWRRGNIPETAVLEKLAQIIVERSDLGKSWLQSFLASADYSYAPQFCAVLFRQETPRSSTRQTEILDPPLPIIKPFRSLIGREDDVKKLSNVLGDPSAKQMIGIDGVGGIGKSALAHELADLCRHRGFFQHIVWVSIRHDSLPSTSDLTWEAILDAIAQELGLAEFTQASVAERETRVHALLRRQASLIVFDNLEIATSAQNELLARIRPLLGISKLLATSRQRFRGDLFEVHLKGLTAATGRRFLQQEACERGVSVIDNASAQELTQIVTATGGSPLAMKLIVGQLHLFPLQQVLVHLQQAALLRQADSSDEYADLFRFIYLPSWARLAQPAHDLLVWLAIFSQPAGGDFAALRAISGWDDVKLRGQLHSLWQVSFLETNHLPAMGLQGNRYCLHALTHYFVKSDVVKATLFAQDQQTDVYAVGVKRYIDYFLAYLMDHARDYARLDVEADNLVEAVRLAAQQAEPLRFVQATQRLVNYLLVRGSYLQAQQLLQLARQRTSEAGLRAELTTILTLQGRVLIKQGLSAEAHNVLQTALAYATAEQEAVLVADARQASAELAINLSDFAAATADLHQVLTYVREQNDQGRLTYVLYLLGRSACFASELQQAQIFLHEGLTVARHVADAELMIPVLIQLAGLAGMQAEFGKAESFAHEALKLAESINHREWTASALKNLAGALIVQGNIEDGATYARRGIDIAQQIGQLELASGLLNNLAVGVSNDGYLHNDRAKLEEGLRYYLEGLEIVREQGNRERMRSCLTNAAMILVVLGRLHQAENYLVEADALVHAIESEWSIADTKIAWGKLLVAQRKFEQAAQAFQIALDNAERAAIPEIQADAGWGLAQVAEGQKNYPAAHRLGLAALQLMEEIQLNTDARALRDWLDKLPPMSS